MFRLARPGNGPCCPRGITVKSGRVEAEEKGDGPNLSLESVVRLAGNPPVVLRKRGPRTFEEIPPSEVAEMMQSLIRTHAGVGEEVLYRQVLDFYDLKRLTSNVVVSQGWWRIGKLA